MRYEDILYFWFTEAGPKKWWKKSRAFDQLITRRFEAIYQRAFQGELAHWRATARGRLAEIIILDQFARNMFRGTARSFEADPVALVLAQEAILAGVDKRLSPDECSFLYMPFMHSESLTVHETALRLFSKPGFEENLKSEKEHLAVLKRFGRYPHRNDILGRKSTPKERAFLKQPGSRF